MVKRVLCLLFIGLLLFSFASAQTLDTSALEDVQESVGGVRDKFDEVQRWDYLSDGWREFFLKNRIIASIDGFFKKIDLVIFILIGDHYQLGLTFIGSLALWVLFFIFISKGVKAFSMLSNLYSAVIGVLGAVILGHANLYSFVTGFLLRAIFYRGGVWSGLWFAFLILGYFFLISYVEKIFIGMRKSLEKLILTQKVEKTEAFVEGIKEMT